MTVTRKYNPEVRTMNYFAESQGGQSFGTTTEQLNETILKDFYAAVDWLLSQKYEEYHEIYSNTINPAQQNAFMALRAYRVKRNGHYKSIRIFQRGLGGCYITECNLANEWSV